MTVTLYRSTDTGAPVINGLASSLIPFFDAILVNGYGSKAPQAWSKVYVGTSGASYQMPSGTNQRWLDVLDLGTYGRVTGYEAMTGLALGSGLFPSAVQVPAGLALHKSQTSDNVARPWYVYANGKMLYIFIATDSSLTNPIMGGLMYGDITSYIPQDIYNTVIISGTSATTGVGTGTQNLMFADFPCAFSGVMPGHYMPRNYTGIGSAEQGAKFCNASMAGCFYGGAGIPKPMGYYYGYLNSGTISVGTSMPFPAPGDNGLYMDKIWYSGSTVIRGELPGLWVPLQNAPLNHLDTFQGTGALAGKSFECLRPNLQASYYGACNIFMEVSNTW